MEDVMGLPFAGTRHDREAQVVQGLRGLEDTRCCAIGIGLVCLRVRLGLLRHALNVRRMCRPAGPAPATQVTLEEVPRHVLQHPEELGSGERVALGQFRLGVDAGDHAELISRGPRLQGSQPIPGPPDAELRAQPEPRHTSAQERLDPRPQRGHGPV